MFACVRAFASILVFLAFTDVAAAAPRRVLLLHSFGVHFTPWNAVAGQFREELAKTSPEAIDLYEASLETARLPQMPDAAPFVDYLRALFAGNAPDLVVALGAPAARFVQRHRAELFPSTALLIGGSDIRAIDPASLTPNDAVVASTLDLPRLIENILQVLPQTNTVAVVLGASPLERFWTEELRRSFAGYGGRINFRWLTDLSLEEMLKYTAALPANSAILYGSVRVDARGIPHEEDKVLLRLHASANAPIFGYIDVNVGHGVVGGPHLPTRDIGQQMASVAARILSGETPGEIKTPLIGLQDPVYDWRELRRWKISDQQLPPRSTIEFRNPTLWQQYRERAIGILAVLLLQGVVITWLVVERRYRLNVEMQSRNRLATIMHLNGAAEVGALSASFAHDLSQPLVAVMMHIDGAERLLRMDPPARGKLKSVLAEMRHANQQALDIIERVKKLLRKKSEIKPEQFDIHAAIANAVRVLRPEAKRRGVSVRTNCVERPLLVWADKVHIEQVILNLAINAMDAVMQKPIGDRAISVETALANGEQVEVSVDDSGAGIPAGKLHAIFDAFYTTKSGGTGLGLSIAKTIVESYGGRIWAQNRPGSGASIRFTLPLANVLAFPRYPRTPSERARIFSRSSHPQPSS